MAEVAMGNAARVYQGILQEVIDFAPLPPDQSEQSLTFTLPHHIFLLGMREGEEGQITLQLKPQNMSASDTVRLGSQIVKPELSAETIRVDVQRGRWFNQVTDASVLRKLGLGQVFVDWSSVRRDHDPKLLGLALNGLTGRLSNMAVGQVIVLPHL